MFEVIIASNEADSIMARYMSTFIKDDYSPWNKEYNCSNLPWCYFKVGIKTLDISYISKIDIHPDKTVYCHDEQRKTLYQTQYSKVLRLVAELEPWDEIDVEVFDNSLEWTVAITHEGEVIFCGVEVLS